MEFVYAVHGAREDGIEGISVALIHIRRVAFDLQLHLQGEAIDPGFELFLGDAVEDRYELLGFEFGDNENHVMSGERMLVDSEVYFIEG